MNEINREIDRLKRPDHRFDTKFQIGYSLTNMAQKYSSQLTDLDDHANLIFMEKQLREMKLIDSKQRANEDSLLSSKILSPVLEHMVEFQIAEKIKHAIRKCIPEGLVSALLAAGERETGIYVATGTVINKLKESLTICGIRAETVAMKLRRDEKIYLKEIFSKGYTYHNCEQLKLAVLSCWKKNEDDLDWEICSLIYNHLDTSQCVDN